MENFTFREAIEFLIDYQNKKADRRLVRVKASDKCVVLVELFNGVAGVRIQEHQLWPIPELDVNNSRSLQDEDAMFDGWMLMSDVLPPNFPDFPGLTEENDD